MALYDNKHWALTNTRNSFISSDDTGICEVVMVSDNIAKQTPMGKYDSYSGVDQDDDEDDVDALAQSFEIHSELQVDIRRMKSVPAERLMRTENVQKASANTLHIKWASNPVPLTDEEKDELFPKADIEQIRAAQKEKQVSLLTELLAKTPSLPQNPFQRYAKFDGNAQVGVATKRYGIFITMLPEKDRNYPVRVVIIATAKVLDLVGLVCWKCSNEFPDLVLKESVYYYSLYIAEDDGEVDWDFPYLDYKESVSKFGFKVLALVESEVSLQPDDSTSSNQPEESLPLNEDSMLGKRAKQQMEEELERMKKHTTAIEAPIFQAFDVYMLNRMRVRAEVHLGVSGEKIEIDPVIEQGVSSKLWGRRRIISHPIDTIVACDLIENRSNYRAIFRVVYSRTRDTGSGGEGRNFKSHMFEADSKTAAEIVQKVNNILEVLQSEKRKEYIALRERKAHRRKSFYLGPR